jgi:hypothetical protein
MPLQLINSDRLVAELAAGDVSEKEQAQYLVTSFVAWIIPAYLFLIPSFYSKDRTFTLALWAYEGVMLVIIYVVGCFYCLRNCTVDPRRHFLKDFGCLYAPISLTTLAVVWGAYHAFVIVMGVLTNNGTASEVAWVLRFLYSERFLDVLRVVCTTGVTAIVFYRIGRKMAAVGDMRNDG